MITYRFGIVILLAAFLATGCSSQKKATAKSEKNISQDGQQQLATNKRMEFETHFFEGVKHSMLENYERAAESFQRALRVDPSSAVVYHELSKINFYGGRSEIALDQSKRATQLDKENIWYALLLANIYQYQKNYAAAASVYETITAKHPGNPQHLNDLASLYIHAEKYSEALKTYERIEKQFGFNPEVVTQKARLYLSMDRHEKAAEEIQRLSKAFPNDMRYLQMLAEIYSNNKMQDKAATVYKRMLEIDPDNHITQLALADYYRRNNEPAKEREMLQKAFSNPSLDIDTKVKIFFSNYLVRGVEENKKEEAFSLAQILVKQYPDDARIHAMYGDLLYQDKQAEEARKHYRISLEQQQDIYLIWQQVLFINSELGDFESMKKESQKALELFPNQPILYLFNGIAHSQMKEYRKAVEILEEGVAITVDNMQLASQFHTNIADAYHRLEEHKSSDKHFELAIKIQPLNATALNNYSYYLSLRKERLEEAKKMSARSLEIDPENASFLDTYGWILYKMGNYQEAKSYIEKSLKKNPDSYEVTDHMGDVLYKLGDVEGAMKHWKKAKELGSTSEFLPRKISDRKLYE